MRSGQVRVAVIGTGNIGADLCERLLLDKAFAVVALIGRRVDSPGLLRFDGRIPLLLSNGAAGLKGVIEDVDGIFDATSALDHPLHWSIAEAAGKWAIDLTPAKVGTPFVPALQQALTAMRLQHIESRNFSMVSCGGQSSAPILYAFSQACRGIRTVEISSSIASKSAGPATRRNIDQYIETTEHLARLVTGSPTAKAILVLNPAEPPVMMRTTVHVEAAHIDVASAIHHLSEMARLTAAYAPGYAVTVEPYLAGPNVLTATARVTGAGYYLPSYAGNLDIINAAAVETARAINSLRTEGQS